ncbi:MAG: hypothetical protein JNG83_00765 [Opitutaceae bacterium]|nr:hypothetical protein [Opitutaceae bacterium]
MPRPSTPLNARQLSQKWGVDAAHVLYHHKGAWYHVLRRFPAALFDPQGYVRFETEEQYLSAPQLKRRKHLHVTGGIRSLPGYQWGQAPAAPLAVDLNPPKRTSSTVYRILRDTDLARRMKAKCGYACQLCGFKLTLPDGTPYIEAHHVHPLGAPHDGPDIEENILCVCPNHHAALDYGTLRLEVTGSSLGQRFIDYHNRHVFGQKTRRRGVRVPKSEEKELST